MPESSRPSADQSDDGFSRILGVRLHVSIIAYLRSTPNETTAQIAAALGAPRPTVIKAIERLIDLDLLIADPPRDTATRGQWIRYRVNDELVTEMYLALGQAMEEL